MKFLSTWSSIFLFLFFRVNYNSPWNYKWHLKVWEFDKKPFLCLRNHYKFPCCQRG
jgi:hypothetical protein